MRDLTYFLHLQSKSGIQTEGSSQVERAKRSRRYPALDMTESLNMRLVGQTDLNGHGDCMHINVKDGFAYIGHMGESRVGTSVVDVSDPSRPRVVKQLETPVGTHSHKVQVVGDVLLVNYERSMFEPQAPSWQGGLKVVDISRPAER